MLCFKQDDVYVQNVSACTFQGNRYVMYELVNVSIYLSKYIKHEHFNPSHELTQVNVKSQLCFFAICVNFAIQIKKQSHLCSSYSQVYKDVYVQCGKTMYITAS